jgi:tetratricopeptide (TPR) repeat protein
MRPNPNARAESPRRGMIALVAVLLGALAIVPYLPVLSAGFTNWDDTSNITTNPNIRGLSAENWAWAWKTRQLGVYEPLSWTLKAAIVEAFPATSTDGAPTAPPRPSPHAMHAVSLVLHAGCTVLLFLVSLRLVTTAAPTLPAQSAVTGAAIAVLLFAEHPLRVEVVAWASAQSYLVAIFFSFLSVLLYLRAADAGDRPGVRLLLLTGALVAYGGALLGKSAAVMLPLILLVLDVYPLRRIRLFAWPAAPNPSIHRDAAPAAPFVWIEKFPLLIAGGIMATIAASIPTVSEIPDNAISQVDRIAIAAHAPLFYISKTLWPADLLPLYALPRPFDGVPATFVAAIPVGILAAVLLIVLHRRWPGLVAACLAYLILLAPVSGIVRHGDQFAADRYAYLSMAGFAVVLSGLLARAMQLRRLRIAVFSIAMAVFLAEGVATWRQSQVWHDGVTLWQHALSIDHNNWMSHRQFANAWLERGDFEAALQACRDGLKDNPDDPDILCTGGIALQQLGQLDTAADWYHQAIEQDPTIKNATANLIAVLYQLGRYDEGVEVSRRRFRSGPDDVASHLNTALCLAALGRVDEAETHLRHVIDCSPSHVSARRILAQILAGRGDLPEARKLLREQLRRMPNDARSRQLLSDLGN